MTVILLDCPRCGRVVEDTPAVVAVVQRRLAAVAAGNYPLLPIAVCPQCNSEGRRVAESRQPFTFTRDGVDFICSWHPGHDVTHPANAGANHGMCDACMARETGDWR